VHSMWSKVQICGVSLAGFMVLGHVGYAQTAKSKSKGAVNPAMAVWTPDVQKTLGVSQDNFNAEGLNKLTKMQLFALMSSARPDPSKQILTCPASGTMPAGRIRVFVAVAGDDPNGAIATAIKQAVGSLSGVDVVDSATQADRSLHVVIQEQTMNKRTIGFTASYLTGTPCLSESGGKKTDAELKGTLGTYTDAKGPDLGKDLAGMMDQDLQPLRTSGRKAQ
jgi:hypothetical protein